MDKTTNIIDDDYNSLLSEQRSELMAAQFLDSDLDFAYKLQLEEALSASLSLLPSSSSSSPPQPAESKNDVVLEPSLSSFQSLEIDRLQLELNDKRQAEIETLKLNNDLNRRIHDQRVAREIQTIPESEWSEWGDDFERPYNDVGSSSRNEESWFRMYFKGLTTEEIVKDKKVILAGIGVAICDTDDNLVYEIKKPLLGNGRSRNAAECKALIEGLNAVLALDIKRLVIVCHYRPIFQFITGRWPSKQKNVAMLVNQVSLLQKKLQFCRCILVPPYSVKYAFKLAKDAVVSQATRPAESSCSRSLQEACVICLEDTDAVQIFSVDGCQHRYCFSCMKQHVEVKLLHAIIPKCPHEGCKSELTVESCKKFLTPKLIETMCLRIKEASIPVSEKVYCPYPKCSALMARKEVSDGSERSGARKCLKCHGLFCINCKVPWHSNMTCDRYKMLNPNPPAEELKLKSLASRNLWRQCVKCKQMIELAEGCYHMTCRCGSEFCYNCGAEWEDKKATCNCPIWDEDHILLERLDSDDDEFLLDDDDDYDFDFEHHHYRQYGSDSDSDYYF